MRKLVLLGLCTLAAARLAAAVAPATGEVRARLLADADARRYDATGLAAASHRPEAEVRVSAARLLGLLANPAGVDLLARLARDANAGVRAVAAESSGRLAADLDGAPKRRLGAVLARLLADRDAAVRRAAAWGVGRGELADADAVLLARLKGEADPGVRAACLAELWRGKGGGWVPTAAAALDDPRAAVRLAAAFSLARGGGGRDAIPALGKALGDADPEVGAVAADGARRTDPSALADALIAATADADARVRIAALTALAGAFEARSPVAPTPALEARLGELIATDDPTLVHERVAAIRLAGAARCCADPLRVAVAANVSWVSGEALGALVRQHADGASTLVLAWLGSDRLDRRLVAVRLLPMLSDGGARLVAVLADTTPAVRLAAVESAAEVPGDEIGSALASRLSDADAAVRAAAVEELGRRKALPGAEVLLGLLGKEAGVAMPDAAVAIVGALATGEHLPKPVKAALAALARGKDPVLARTAWAALRRHGVILPLPTVDTGRDLGYYEKVLDWAGEERWIELVTVRGTMLIRLDTARAPLTCSRLVELVDKKFFENLTFHRVVPDFVVQGGDPRGDGWGGPGYAVRDELDLGPFNPGAVGIALSGPDTGGSQLFVTLTRQPHLDGCYPRVGEVVSGLDVAWRFRPGDRILRARSGEGPLPAYFHVSYGVLAPATVEALAGWREEREKYQPNQHWLELLESARLRYDLVIAMGTWCSDSREQVPRLEKLLATLGEHSPFTPPRLIGVDRSKEVVEKLYPFGPVELVPTMVVTMGGSEIGRIVETPASGSLEEDLARILAPVEGWSLPEPTAAAHDVAAP